MVPVMKTPGKRKIIHPAQNGLGFMDLPLEIRAIIYDTALESDFHKNEIDEFQGEEEVGIYTHPEYDDLEAPPRHRCCLMSLALACRQTYHEVLPMLYRKLDFRMDVQAAPYSDCYVENGYDHNTEAAYPAWIPPTYASTMTMAVPKGCRFDLITSLSTTLYFTTMGSIANTFAKEFRLLLEAMSWAAKFRRCHIRNYAKYKERVDPVIKAEMQELCAYWHLVIAPCKIKIDAEFDTQDSDMSQIGSNTYWPMGDLRKAELKRQVAQGLRSARK